MTVGVTQARHVGATRVACASTGNTAASMAAYAARGGVAARAYLPKGAVSAAKLAQTIDYGAEVVEVDGNFDAALSQMLLGCESRRVLPELRQPVPAGGSEDGDLRRSSSNSPGIRRTTSCCPAAIWATCRRSAKGSKNSSPPDLLKQPPRLVVVQADGANPFVRLWRSGAAALEPIAHPQTAATAIRIGAPCSWKKALRALRFTNGTAVDVSEEEIADAKAAIGREGIGCEPASATTLGGGAEADGERRHRTREHGRRHPDRTRAQGSRFHHSAAGGRSTWAVTRLRTARPSRVALLGFGTVGQSVARILCSGEVPQLRLTHIFNRQRRAQARTSTGCRRPCTGPSRSTTSLAPDVDIVIELVGGLRPAERLGARRARRRASRSSRRTSS